MTSWCVQVLIYKLSGRCREVRRQEPRNRECSPLSSDHCRLLRLTNDSGFVLLCGCHWAHLRYECACFVFYSCIKLRGPTALDKDTSIAERDERVDARSTPQEVSDLTLRPAIASSLDSDIRIGRFVASLRWNTGFDGDDLWRLPAEILRSTVKSPHNSAFFASWRSALFNDAVNYEDYLVSVKEH
jgi:hypothetical protein